MDELGLNVMHGNIWKLSNAFSLSSRGERFLKLLESPNGKYNATLYDCPAKHATIGWGHLVHRGPVDAKNPKEKPFRDKNGNLRIITKTEAQQLFDSDLAKAIKWIKKNVKVRITQSMFDALVSVIHNIGIGAASSSKFLKSLNDEEYFKAGYGFLGFLKPRSLTKRRLKETSLFLAGLDPLKYLPPQHLIELYASSTKFSPFEHEVEQNNTPANFVLLRF